MPLCYAKMPAPECYTVGWICAIGVEYFAAQLLLDQKHTDDFAAGPNDNNAYTRGTMGQHNIVAFPSMSRSI